jgi:histidinol-phosphate aminotransferase
MERRAFLRSGIAAGAVGLAAPITRGARRPLHSPRGTDGPIRLASNENPLGLAPAAREAVVAAMGDANRYPRRRGELIDAISRYHGVPRDQIALGAGSTEVLKMAVQALSAPDGTLVAADPTYEDAFFYATPFPIRVVKVPLGPQYAHDLGRMREAAEASPGPALVYLCNPNNPTGTITPSAAIDAWIGEAPENVFFLVDEAYFDFVDDSTYWSAFKWVPDRPNVLVARTFSKIFGMAGIRLGYGITNPSLARRLERYQVRNNANHFAIVAGLASLGDRSFIDQSLRVNRQGKRTLQRCLDELGLEYLPSHTNFVMHGITGDVRQYRDRMNAEGIWVGRPFPPMLDHCRVSIGLPEEMRRLTDTMRRFREEGAL